MVYLPSAAAAERNETKQEVLRYAATRSSHVGCENEEAARFQTLRAVSQDHYEGVEEPSPEHEERRAHKG
jgi:hypothetical protein